MGALTGIRRWLQAQPLWVADGLLAVLIAFPSLVLLWRVAPAGIGSPSVGPTPLAVALTLVTTLPVALRRVRPDATLAIVGLGMVAAAWVSVPSPGLGLVVALYSYAAHTEKDDALIVLAVFGFFTIVSLFLAGGLVFLPVNLVIFATAWVLGDRQRVHRLRTRALERQAEALEHERAVAEQLAAAKERAAISEEIHDVVGHGVTAMIAQAVGAARTLRSAPEAAGAALAAAEEAGRASLAELRRLVGILRVGAASGSASADVVLPADDDALHVPAARPLGRVPGRLGDLLLLAGVVAVDVSILLLVAPEDLGIPGYGGPSALGVAALIVAAVPLLWRRRAPLAVLGITTGLGLLLLAVPLATQQLAPLAALYTVAARCDRRASFSSLAALCALVVVLLGGLGDLGALPVQVATVVTAWLLGDAQRARDVRAAALAERTRALLADRERAGELAAMEERGRIARELHDVVAHSIGVMVVQAGAARRVLDRDPDAAIGAAQEVVGAGRRTLAELRDLLGLLRADGVDAAYEPQPGLDGLDELVERVGATGLHVIVRVEGQPRPLPAGVDLSAYRIVQESLTNVLRHADAETAEVRLSWSPDALRIRVADDGRGPLVGVAAGTGGHGLVGMRERAVLVGGTLETTSRPGGGFVVDATLPTEG